MAKTLEQVILGAAVHFVNRSLPWENWEESESAKITREELLSEVFLRVQQPQTLAKLNTIWRNPDPHCGCVRGVSKYIGFIVRSAFIDCKRELKRQRREISLSTPIGDDSESENGDDNLTLEEILVTDATAADDSIDIVNGLKEQLSDGDFEILRRSIIEGFGVREIAKDTGMSKSAVSRRLNRAKKTARKYATWLKRSPSDIARAKIVPTFSTRTLRPDRISPENLEAFRCSLQDRIAPFHDPELEWRERHYASIRRQTSLAAD